jgi:hypothetical protein
LAERRVIGPEQVGIQEEEAQALPTVIRMTLEPREFGEVTYEEALAELIAGGWDAADAEFNLRAGRQLRAPESVLLIRDFADRDGVNHGQ